ncbi:MAG TPA: exodeoxyribonuclease VII large subunit [Oscillatoriales cyanobacterium M59_W2019_021]|nr:MAG: exodeoxyribonuclease VII large subunit [Cyanobacteria bacterium J055]HIK33494.1 exodeoxyribonuclease VII large subunit [Oscillatoriales cyanobacterium M4454_W2019_049]HIK50234.1 exodeoxyribonuclease VII large subunit [Oscillatoriales cyanobacterium M59_W2019_021]
MTSLPEAATIAESPLSVTGLTEYIQAVLEDDPQLRRVWVVGEVSNAKPHSSGTFFTLRDSDGEAAVQCVAWRSQLPKLAALPVVGEQIIVLGGLRVYPPRGEYRLYVWQALPAGEGLQALRYRQLHDRLAAEGLFDENRKRSLPPHPQTIAVVTSPQAAAWGDIQRTLKQRYPGLHVLLSPAVVQGVSAPASIAAAIDRVGNDGRAELLILARGGGAVEDLACFNDERVVRAIATCPVPVITGIGHQRDESLADLAADVCAHTPTAAAERAVPSLEELSVRHRMRVAALSVAVADRLQQEKWRFQQLQQRLHRVFPDRQLQREQEDLHRLRDRLIRATKLQLQREIGHYHFLQEKLAALDPYKVLQRGYAVVRQETGEIARSATELAEGETLTIQFSIGRVRVKILEIEKADNQ